MIEVEDLKVSFGDKLILDTLNVSLNAQVWTCLVGPNGSGKTTFLKAILGMLPYAGSLKDNSREVFHNQSRNVAFVPQQPQIPMGMMVAEYVMLGRAKRDGWGNESLASRILVHEILLQTELYDLRNQYVSQLSGGEMQRALIARALAQEPELILLDEPTSALDLHHQISTLNNIELLKNRGVTIISTMHDITLAAMYAEDIVVMHQGKILLAGPAHSVIHSSELKEAFDNRINVYTLDSGRPVIVALKEDLY